MGATHVNKILTGLGVPPLSPCTIKKREREILIGPMVEALAKESCKATKEKEIALSKRDWIWNPCVIRCGLATPEKWTDL